MEVNKKSVVNNYVVVPAHTRNNNNHKEKNLKT